MLRMAAMAICGMILAPTAGADVLGEIAERGSIRLGVRADAPPFSYVGRDNVPAGLAVRLCHAVAERLAGQLGLETLASEHVIVSAERRFQALDTGLTDLHCGPASATLRRREFIDFSIIYFVDGAAPAGRGDAYERVFENREGRFGALAGTTTVAVVEDLITRNDLEAETQFFASHDKGLQALVDGELDLYFGDQSILLFQIEAMELTGHIAVREDILSFEPYALAMRRGEAGLRLAVDRALSSLYDDGSIYQMIQAEMGDYPLSPEARAVYQIVGLPE